MGDIGTGGVGENHIPSTVARFGTPCFFQYVRHHSGLLNQRM
jgi:hypothetical protein